MTRGRGFASALAVLVLVACAPEKGTIGAMLAQSGDRRLTLREVPKGLAADRAGLREGDEILLIEGRDVRGMGPKEVHQALSGELDDPVKLTLVRENAVIRVTLRRTRPPPQAKKTGPATAK